MKTLNNISRFIVGVVFIFSGFVKAIDPLGSTYKFVDYFEAFGLDAISFIAFPMAILLSSLEFVIGFSLLFSTRRKTTSWALLIFMSFFTVLTFILAIFNPVTDCGCFGDAIIMTNWQTFYKNIFLMIFTLIVFYNRNNFEISWNVQKQWFFISIPLIFSILISVYCYNNLPIIDFRPYNVGTYIPEKMIIPEDAPRAKYETILVYQKDGIEQEFTMENLPDSTWEWVSTENKLISEGYVPPIHDFTISTSLGNDITEVVLNDNKFTFLLISYDLNKANKKHMDEINDLALSLEESGVCNFICLTSSLDEDIDRFKAETNAIYLFFNTDEITLKTMIRANPGIVLLKQGTILNKWHYKNTPSYEEIKKDFIENPEFKNQVAPDGDIPS
ncbi:MAG: DoxX family protein [Marinilabiliales bacterium]|nr:MAG: DoxX family protein [Marinilabiliales bacterium]